MKDKFVGFGAITGLVLALVVTFFYVLAPNSFFVSFVFEKFLINGGVYPDTRTGSIFSFMLIVLSFYGIFLGGLLGLIIYKVISHFKNRKTHSF